MEFGVLGGLRVLDGTREIDLPGLKARTLLAVLACHANEAVPRDRLIDAIWADHPPRTAADNLRVYVAQLRKALGDPGRIVARRSGYLLVAEPAELDAHRFDELATRGRAALAAGRPVRASELLTAALDLWRGPALADLDAAMLRDEAMRLTERRLTAWEDRIDADLAAGRHAELAGELRAVVAEHPLLERFHAQLMVCLYRSGRQVEALAHYERLRRRLADELGIDPGPEPRRVHQQILTGDPALSPAPGPRQLPPDIADFTGRDAELDRLLAVDAGPVRAIDGMPGIGKTALAVHAAHRLASRYPDAQLFLDLRAHTAGHEPTDPVAALGALLRAMGVPGERVPTGLDECAALWRDELAHRKALILLDNASSAAQVRPLLPGGTNSLVLVTSRRRLVDLDAAHTVSLDGLPPEQAATLFTRVAGARREIAAVAEVVRLCGRLPLAIRIAGARLRSRPVWTVEHLAGRMRDGDQLGELATGERSVAAAFMVSYQHLTADQQRMFRLLGRHPGVDFDGHLAATAADLALDKAELLIEALVDVHLLQQPGIGRYRCHDLLHDYAVRLAETDPERDAASARVLAHYQRTAARAMDIVVPHEREFRPAVGRSTQAFSGYEQAMTWLDTERPNLLAVAPGDPWTMSAIVWHYLHIRGHHDDAMSLHGRALDQARADGDRDRQSHALIRLGLSAIVLGHAEDAIPRLDEALALARETGNELLQGNARHHLGLAHMNLGHLDTAIGHFQRSLARSIELGYRYYEGHIRHHLGIAYVRSGRYDEAFVQLRVVLEIARETGYHDLEPEALNGLGEAARASGDHTAAVDYHAEALGLAVRNGDRDQQARAHSGIAHAHHTLGRQHEARPHWEQALDLYVALGMPEADHVRQHLDA